jgi:hypothetical protein
MYPGSGSREEAGGTCLWNIGGILELGESRNVRPRVTRRSEAGCSIWAQERCGREVGEEWRGGRWPVVARVVACKIRSDG